MKKLFTVGAIIVLLLGLFTQVFAGYTIRAQIEKVTGTGTIRSGACNLKTINLFGPTAGNYISVYDATGLSGTTQGELKFEVGISANNSSQSFTFGTDGVDFSTGIYVVGSVATILTTAVFDY